MAKYDGICENAYVEAKKETAIRYANWLDSPWIGFFDDKDSMVVPPTGIDEANLKQIGGVFSTPPPDFKIHGG